MIDLRGTLIENWPIKLVSLALAVTTWFYVTSTGRTELTMTVPLELRNVPQGLAVVGDVPGQLEVRLQGQERLLRDITTGKKVIGVLDLGRGREGDNTLHLSPDDIRRPAGVNVTYLAQGEIVVKLERLVQRTFRLLPVLQGRPAAGHRLASAAANPARITLEGPAGTVRAFPRLRTLPIDITDLKGTTVVSARIDYQGKPVRVLEEDIRVTIVIQKERP